MGVIQGLIFCDLNLAFHRKFSPFLFSAFENAVQQALLTPISD